MATMEQQNLPSGGVSGAKVHFEAPNRGALYSEPDVLSGSGLGAVQPGRAQSSLKMVQFRSFFASEIWGTRQ